MSASGSGMDGHLVTGHQIDGLYDIYFSIFRPVRPYEVVSADEINESTALRIPKLQNAGQI